jgi:hypothetical protein
MLIVALLLGFIGLVTAIIAAVWTLVLAVQRSWSEIKTPLLLLLAAFVAVGLSAFCLPHTAVEELRTIAGGQRPLTALADQFKTPSAAKKAASPTPSDARAFVDHSMFGAATRAELQIRLLSLRQKEANLQERKAELDPNDSAGAAKLATEINQYNAELKPVTEAIRAHPEWKLQ